jgi:transposase
MRLAQRGDPAQEALGRSRGGFSTKLHVRAEGRGRPLTFVLSGGQEADCRYVPALLERGAVKSGQGGRPRLRPDRVVGNKGYSYRVVRRYLQRRGIGRVIPRRRDQGRHGPFDRAAYRLRHRIECLVNRLKQWRRVATRYEKRARNYLAMVTIRAILLWL